MKNLHPVKGKVINIYTSKANTNEKTGVHYPAKTTCDVVIEGRTFERIEVPEHIASKVKEDVAAEILLSGTYADANYKLRGFNRSGVGFFPTELTSFNPVQAGGKPNN
jgi:hypothetical protein